MDVVDDLQEMLDEALDEMHESREALQHVEQDLLNAVRRVNDLKRAIAALDPPAEAEPEPLPAADDPPEPVEHISVLTGDPAIEPETGLHGEGYAPVTDPEPLADPIWNEPEQERVSPFSFQPERDQ